MLSYTATFGTTKANCQNPYAHRKTTDLPNAGIRPPEIIGRRGAGDADDGMT